MQSRRLEQTGQAKRGNTRRIKGTGPALTRQEEPGRVFGWVWNCTDQFLQSKPGPLVGYLDPLLILMMMNT
jgi:hypothetical protein